MLVMIWSEDEDDSTPSSVCWLLDSLLRGIFLSLPNLTMAEGRPLMEHFDLSRLIEAIDYSGSIIPRGESWFQCLRREHAQMKRHIPLDGRRASPCDKYSCNKSGIMGYTIKSWPFNSWTPQNGWTPSRLKTQMFNSALPSRMGWFVCR